MKKIKLHKGKKYSICSCGLSKALPFCDNEHRDFNMKNNTKFKSVKIIPDCDVTIKMESKKWNLNGSILRSGSLT